MKKYIVAVLTGSFMLGTFPSKSFAQRDFNFLYPHRKQNEIALKLATLLAAEEFCGLKYDVDSVKAYYKKKSKPDPLMFSAMMTGLYQLKKGEQLYASPALKKAHCSQIEESAKAYGFIK